MFLFLSYQQLEAYFIDGEFGGFMSQFLMGCSQAHLSISHSKRWQKGVRENQLLESTQCLAYREFRFGCFRWQSPYLWPALVA